MERTGTFDSSLPNTDTERLKYYKYSSPLMTMPSLDVDLFFIDLYSRKKRLVFLISRWLKLSEKNLDFTGWPMQVEIMLHEQCH